MSGVRRNNLLACAVTAGLVLGAGLCPSPASAELPFLKRNQEAKKEAAEQKEKPADAGAKQSFKPYDRDWVGDMQSHVATYDDTFVKLAREYNVGYVELRSANPYLDPWIPGEGKKLIIPTMHILPRATRQGVVINVAEMRMYIYKTPGKAPLTYPIGIGRDGLLTPVGETTIVRKKDGPTWRPTARMREENPELPAIVPPGPDNPMGTHAIYLGWPEYAIHGTDKPYSIGRRVSSGCIRMYPEDIIKAFELIPVGAKITVVDQPIKAGWVGKKLFLEVHPTTDQADRMEIDGGLPGYVFSNDDMGLIVDAAGAYADDLDWSAVRRVVRERRGIPVEIFRVPAETAKTDAAPEPVKSENESGTANPDAENSDKKAEAASDADRKSETNARVEKFESEKIESEKIGATKPDDAKSKAVIDAAAEDKADPAKKNPDMLNQ